MTESGLGARDSWLIMKCKKCGASLRKEQKICMDCGAPTDYMPGLAGQEEETPLQIPWMPIAIIGGGLVVVIALIVIAMSLRVVPPDEVTQKWLNAVTSRSVKDAQQYTTPKFEATIVDRPASAEMADQYFLFIHDNKADFSVSKPQFQSQASAVVTVTFTGKNGLTLVNQVYLVRQGKEWNIDFVDG